MCGALAHEERKELVGLSLVVECLLLSQILWVEWDWFGLQMELIVICSSFPVKRSTSCIYIYISSYFSGFSCYHLFDLFFFFGYNHLFDLLNKQATTQENS